MGLSSRAAAFRKKAVVKRLIDHHDIVFLLEARGAREDQLRWTWELCTTHLVFADAAANGSAGGVIALVSKQLLELPGLSIAHKVVSSARAAVI